MKIVSRMKRMWLVVAALVCASVAWAGNLASGTYYMKNVAAGKYLTGGNAWGTQASLGVHGLDIKAEVLENGKYTLDSNVPNGTNKYLGSIGYIDCEATEWTLVEVAPQTYAITADGVNYIGYDGSTTVVNLALTDATSPAAHWEFITKDDLIADMASATATNPVDATFFIVGQGFNRGDTNRNTVWQGGPVTGGNNDNMVAEKWNCNFDIYQDLTGLPNGFYKLSAQGFYRAGNGGATSMERYAYLYANEVSTPLQNINVEAGNSVFESGNVSTVEGMGIVPNNMQAASAGFTAGLYADNSVLVEVTDGTLRIGVKKDTLITSDWTMFDNFELTYYGTEKPTEEDDALAPIVKTLAALLEQAIVWKGELNGSDEMHAQVIATLEQMIPVVQEVIDNPESEEAVEQMIADVKAMLDTYMPMIEQYDAKVLATLAIEAAQELMASYTNYTDNAGLAKAIATAQNVLADLGMWDTMYTLEDLNAALTALIAAQEAFLVENADNSGIVDGIRQHPASTITFIEAATDNTPMYMYNVGAQKFFLGANAWATQTSVGDEGYKVYFEQYLTDGSWDGTTVLFRNYVVTQDKIRDVFFDNVNGGCYVDRNSQANYYWKLEKNAGNGYYRLSMAEANPDYQAWQVEMYPDTYVGWDAANGTVVSSFLNPEVEGVHVDWAFVSVEEYDAFANKLAIYNAAQTLKTEIDKAKALNLNVTAQEVVYLNIEATLAEIEKATSEVKNILAAWDEGSVNPYNPVDKTSLIVNPSYDNNKNDGWSGTTPGFQSYGNVEHWNKTFDTYQDIVNVPNGLYKMSVQGFYRPATENATAAVFYADNGTERQTVDVPNINSESELETKPNNMKTSGEAFAAGFYHTELFVNVTTGTLRIGVALPQLTGGSDWVIWDNWRLTYYGNSEDVYSILIDSIANEASYKFDGREAEMTVGTVDTYKAALNGLTATDLASFNAAKAAIADAEAAVQANIDAWGRYAELIAWGNDVRTCTDFSSSTAMNQMAAYVARQAPAILKAKALSTEEVLAECDKLEKLITDAINSSLPDNSDVTDMFLKNAGFEDRTDGKNDGQGWEGKWTDINGPSGNYVMELYGGWSVADPEWDVYQVVKEAPQGVYEISLNGFFRAGEHADAYAAYENSLATGQEIVSHASVYVNNNKSPFKNIYSESVKCGELYSATEIYGPTPWLPVAGDSTGYWYPNGMYDAGIAFANGLYKSSAHGVVAKSGDELRIGVKVTGMVMREWVIFDNFKMIYRGKQLAYVMPHLQEAIYAAEVTLTQPMARDTKELLEAAKANAEAHLNSTNEDAVFDALVQMYAANDSVEASAELFADLTAAAEEVQNAMMIYGDFATEAAMSAAQDLLIQMLMGIEQCALTKEEAKVLLNQVEPTINALIMGDYANASDENPMDFTQLLKSPSFEDFSGMGSAEGWTGATGYMGSGAYEYWQKAFNLYQDLTGLPNGTYRLEVSAYERMGSSIDDYETYLTGADTATTYIYGQSGMAYYDTPVRRLASGAIVSDDAYGIEGMTVVGTAVSGEAIQVANMMASAVTMFNDYGEYLNVMYVEVTDGTLRIGMKKDVVASMDWVMMDNWRLYYHGTNSQYAPGYVPSDKEYSTTNTFSISDAEALKGSPFTLPVSMTNEDGISAFQCDIYLSSGLQMNVNDEGDYDIALNASRATSSHTVASELQPDGAIRVIVYSNGSKLFRGNSGELFTMNLTASSIRNQSVAIRNIRMSTADEQEILTADVTANVTVKNYTPADVNGDGTISIVDVVAVVNNILGRNVGNFIFDAADMDHNGEITIVDVVAVVNALLGRDVQATGARSILRSNLHVSDAEVNAGESTTLYVKLDNAQAYTAMQMDMNLPEGLTIEGVEMVGDASHTVTYNEEGRIAAYSLGNSRFHGGEALMAITVKADNSFTSAANVGFTNVRVVSTDVVETVLADALSTVIGGAKNIDGVEADENIQILYYSTTGAVSDAPHKGLNIIKRIWQDGRVEVNKIMGK
ncbi:MAG: dockerin type I repeat-containing protein [Bacteroidaceae bacterium]|nr:dockerin type I repeat-containing protein [Bacteroidaceae bacterium]